MEIQDCHLDMRIGSHEDFYPCFKGKILAIEARTNSVVVEWDDTSIGRISVDQVMPEYLAVERDNLFMENEAKQHSQWEKDYDHLRKSIGVKLSEAARLIEEASDLTSQAGSGRFTLSEFYDEVKPLMTALDNAGWQSSSLSC